MWKTVLLDLTPFQEPQTDLPNHKTNSEMLFFYFQIRHENINLSKQEKK